MPLEGQKNEIGHGKHALMVDAPALGLYVPAKQAVTVREAVGQKLPAGHASKCATIVTPAATPDVSEYNDAAIGAPQNE